ncbi:MAG: hypothetical protein K2X84_07420 [Beijerinckiaceae bacterium]|nr:hypothetical protein [Beijerinckiaceae bacterium]
MSITFIAAELLKALNACRGIVELRTCIPILSCVVIRSEGTEATVEVTNLDQTLIWRVPCSGDGAFVVPFTMLREIVRHLGPGEMVRIGAAPDNRIRIDFGDGRASLMTLPIADWPDLGSLGAIVDRVTMPVSSLTDLVPFISREETRYYLNGVYLDVGVETVRTVATNGHTLGVICDAAERDADGNGGGFIIPRHAVDWLAKNVGAERLAVDLSAAKARFHGPKFEMTTKLIDGKYPDWQRVVPKTEEPVLMEVDAESFRRKLARLRAVGTPYCGISYDGRRIAASSSGLDHETISLAIGGRAPKPFKLTFQSTLMSDALAFVGGQVSIKAGGEGFPVRIEGDGQRIGVVMPARAGELHHDLPEDIAA